MELPEIRSVVEADIVKYERLLQQARATEKLRVPDDFAGMDNVRIISGIISELKRILTQGANADRP
jgi:hypothetical protein